ncbi:MAG: hypothetical protein IPK04_02400 [Bdellovibrionales bacterium]|nr:hypothetical protein [Bdellovibrionales bacterium]
MFDTLQTPMTEQYIPEQIYGQPYGGVDAAYYSYTKELVAGELGLNVQYEVSHKLEIENLQKYLKKQMVYIAIWAMRI